MTPKSNQLTFITKDFKSLLFKYNLQIFFSTVVFFQLLRFRSQFQAGMVYEGILYTFVPITFVILIRVYFERHACVVELFNILVKFEQNLLRGKSKYKNDTRYLKCFSKTILLLMSHNSKAF